MIDIEKLAAIHCNASHRKLDHTKLTFEFNELALKQFAEAYCQEKQRQQEPVAKINAQWSCPDSLGKKHRERYVQFKNGIIPQEGIELFTYPPDAAKVHDKRVEELEAINMELQFQNNLFMQNDTELEVKLEKKEREIAELKAELNEQLEIKKQMRVAVVQIVDAIAEYFGTRNPAVVKLLEQVKELR